LAQPPPPPEIAFLEGPIGGAVTVALGLAVLAVTIMWARRPGHPDRRAAVLAATATSLLVALITLIAVLMGWWQGAFFQIPLPVAFAIDLPLSIAGYTLWLGLYRWLSRHTRRPFLIYAVGVLIFIPVVLLVDPIQMSRGQFQMGAGYTIWADALVGQLVMLSPVVFYEFLRRRMPGGNSSAA
jgi:hypothetical protein